MSKFVFEIDTEAIAKEFGDLKHEVEAALQRAVEITAVQAKGIAMELANQKLKSRRKTYLDALSLEQVSPTFFVLSLDESAMWVEDGVSPHDQRTTLLKQNYKTSKDGHKYKSIPFEHTKLPQLQTAQAQQITSWVKQELKSRKIPFKKIELDSSGSPRLGKIHSFSVPGSPKPSANAKTGALMGVNIYQRRNEKGKVVRDIMTFRTISSKPGDNWQHPGLDPVHIFEETFAKISEIYDNQILPEILKSFDGRR